MWQWEQNALAVSVSHLKDMGKNYSRDSGVDCLLMHCIRDRQRVTEKLRIVNKQLNTKCENRRPHL